MADGDFARFEHEGWERVAGKYDSVWASSTRQFIPPLLEAAGVGAGMLLLDVGSGPGYVSAAADGLGAKPIGLDFSSEMVGIATKLFPHLQFRVGDAQQLPFDDGSFDRVLSNFALLHVTNPQLACAEACRVLKTGGKFGFTVWAPPGDNPYAKIIDDAIATHGDLDVEMPKGPSHYVFSDESDFRDAMVRAGFDGDSMAMKLHRIEWVVPTARFVFEAERFAGVRTAGLLARQSPDRLERIRQAIEEAVARYRKEKGFAVPKSAYVLVATKKQ